MRVAHIITRLILGGAQENTVLNCHDLIREHGDDVLLITGPPLGPEGSLLEQARARKIPIEVVPQLRRSIHPWRDWRSYRRLVEVLEGFKPDVVHTHSAKGGILGRAAASKAGTPAIVHTVHGAPFHAYQNAISRTLFRQCERWAASRCHGLISVADAMIDLMVDARVAPRDKFTTIYSGMEVEPFLNADDHRQRIRAELGYQEDDVVIGKIARLFKLKGHDDVLAAFAPLAKRNPRAKLLLVGDGIFRDHLAASAKQLGLTNQVTFAGLVAPERVAEMIGAMDLVVHASLREGLARVLPQALLAGKPVVSFDIDGAREVVLDGETGMLIPPRDVARLEEAMEVLVTDAALRQRMGAHGRELCRDRFRHQTMTQSIRELYVRLLQSPAIS